MIQIESSVCTVQQLQVSFSILFLFYNLTLLRIPRMDFRYSAIPQIAHPQPDSTFLVPNTERFFARENRYVFTISFKVRGSR